MLSLEEAIKHCEEVAEKYCEKVEEGLTADDFCDSCASEHRQLAEWLRELKGYRKAIEEVKEYASIWTSYTVDMKPEEIAHNAVTDARDGFLAIVDRCLKEVNADESSETM